MELHPSFSRVDTFVLWGLCSCIIESQAVTGFHLACFYVPVMSEVTGSETRSPSPSGSAETEGTFVLSQQNFLLFSLLLSVLMMFIFILTSHTENKPTLARNLQKVVELHSGERFDLKKRKQTNISVKCFRKRERHRENKRTKKNAGLFEHHLVILENSLTVLHLLPLSP